MKKRRFSEERNQLVLDVKKYAVCVEEIETHEQHTAALDLLIRLIERFPEEPPETEKGQVMVHIAKRIQEFEKKHFHFNKPTPEEMDEFLKEAARMQMEATITLPSSMTGHNLNLDQHIELVTERLMRRNFMMMHETRCMMLIDRSIANTNTSSKRWGERLISHDQEGLLKNLEKLMWVMHNRGNPDLRLYISLNARNPMVARKTYLNELINSFDNPCNWHQGQWVSALMKPNSRCKQWYLIDLDQEDTKQLDVYVAIIPQNPKLRYQTVKGWHYVIEPFDVRYVNHLKNCEVKTDGLMLLAHMGEIGKFEWLD